MRDIKFMTKVEIGGFPFKINYSDSLFFIGSCFADDIGSKFKDYLFKTLVNPFGTLYNPISIKNTLEIIIENKKFEEKDLIYTPDGLYTTYLHHSRVSSAKKEEALKIINNNTEFAHNFLKNTSILFITFGTAWVYILKENNIIVSNCHKMPSNLFQEKLLDVKFLFNEFKQVIEKLLKFNSKINIVLTISPVRYLKYTLHGNQVSKSTLVLFVERLKEEFRDRVYYFPSYEIILDELRDYRFYKEDLVHVNEIGVNYIFNRLTKHLLTKESLELMETIEKFIKNLNHEPKNPYSESYKEFINNNIKQLQRLENIHKEVNWYRLLAKFYDIKNKFKIED